MSSFIEPQSQPLLQINGVSMSYAGPVLQDVHLSLRPGEVRVLAGENGAGKSTLSKIICGLVTPLAGSMRLNGEAFAPTSRAQAEERGVRMVLQELSLVNTLSIAENLFLRKLPSRFGFVDYARLNAAAAQCMAQVGLGALDPATPVSRLGIGQRQMIEIAANISADCKVLILDEPTAMLTGREVDLLFVQIERLKAKGVGIIYISHRLEETKRIADSISVLRDGLVVGTHAADAISIPEVVKLMVGREVGDRLDRPKPQPSAISLKVQNLSRGKAVRDVSFEARGGEIFGIAGLVGSGRTETLRLIYGADRRDSGRVSVSGSERAIGSPYDAVRHGIAMVSEDRKEQGLLLPQSIRVNTTLSGIAAVARAGWLSRNKEGAIAERIGKLMSLRASSVEQPVGQLSGGNQQKIAIGRWLHRECDVMLFDEPTRGIDVGAKFEIYKLMAQLAAQGKALVVVSSDLVELMLLCDRIAVMSAGKMVRTFGRDEASADAIMEAAFSGYVDAAPAALQPI
ncbi:ribose transport system ATP-binding protein [Janthinobacterium sp. CG_23.3]|uniref:sugar ABC transporter ATP-binding protein n=1 Tax=Janthinobacterium sp. CG_23.3 TaxID=3349634 RepID=UPI0038D38849